MNSKSVLKTLKNILLHLCSFLIIGIYIFLIVWTYCYSLHVLYLLITAFLACVVIYCIDRKKRQAMQFLIIGLILFVLLSPFNITQFNRNSEKLQKMVNEKKELSTKAKLGIYGCVIMITVIDIIPFPEAGKENFYLFFPCEEKKRVFHSNSILESPSIMQAVKNKETGFIAWNRWDMVGNKDFRYSLAFDPCTVTAIKKNEHKEVTVTTFFSYRENYPTIHASHFLRGIFAFRVDEGLFYYLQQQGWLYPYTAIWIAELKN
jgi:hypothetical protein